MRISKEFLDFIERGALAVEVWVHRRSRINDIGVSLADERESHQPKSFRER